MFQFTYCKQERKKIKKKKKKTRQDQIVKSLPPLICSQRSLRKRKKARTECATYIEIEAEAYRSLALFSQWLSALSHAAVYRIIIKIEKVLKKYTINEDFFFPTKFVPNKKKKKSGVTERKWRRRRYIIYPKLFIKKGLSRHVVSKLKSFSICTQFLIRRLQAVESEIGGWRWWFPVRNNGQLFLLILLARIITKRWFFWIHCPVPVSVSHCYQKH